MRHSKPTADEIQALIDGQMHLEGPLLPILHALQEAYDHVPEAALGLIAETLNLTKAEVHGVMSFYHDFRKAPAGRHVVKICRAEACQSMGANALSDAVLEKLGIGWGGTTPDGSVTVEAVYCLGLCACAPAAMVDDRLIARADAARLEKALEGAA
ncbi:MAG: formate dehydrogenase subunit gamma [Rhodobacteraceae bacterium]|nr:formate dehydrogenase subunit gamma [Paracoccaceae bacterium]